MILRLISAYSSILSSFLLRSIHFMINFSPFKLLIGLLKLPNTSQLSPILLFTDKLQGCPSYLLIYNSTTAPLTFLSCSSEILKA